MLMIKFQATGYYTISNSSSYEVELSNCFGMARLRSSVNGNVSDWLLIEYITNSDNKEEFVIDPEGFNIPLNQVMKM